MNRLNLLSHLFANSPRWRRVSIWGALLSTAAGATAFAQPTPPTGSQQPEQVFAQAAASDAFVMNQPPSGSVADRGSYSRDIGIGGTGSLARMGHIVGETIGRKQSITHFEVMPYAFVDNTMWYTDGRFYATNNGHIGGTGGVGVRQFLPNINAIIGAGAFYDADDTRAKMFTQAGLSLEYLSEYLDVRTNLYASTGRKSAFLGTTFIEGSEHFVDDNIAFNTRTRRAAATDGLDLTVTVPVPGEMAQSINLEASAGGYHFVANDFDLEDATGYRLRLDGDFLASRLHSFLEFTSDKAFNNNLIVGADLNYYHDVQRRPRIGHNQFNRMAEWVRRNYNVAAIEDSVVNPDELAINPITGLPYVVLHVRNIVPADPDFPNYPAPGGDGSIDTPYQFIDEAQIDPRDADIIFVHSGSVFVNMPVIIEDNQQILGEGVDHPIAVANPIANNGFILMPDATGGTVLPELQDTVGNAVTLANNSVFAGFNIVNTNGTAIFGSGINSSEIRDVGIDGTNGLGSHGLHLENTTGSIRVEQVTTTGVEGTDLFLDGGNSTVNWFGGQLNNTAGRAVVIQNQTGGTINLAGDNATSPALGFGGLTITDNGGDGILISNTSAATVFGRSSDTPSSSAGVSLTNSTTTGVQIVDLLQAGSVSFLHGLEITDAADIALDIQNAQGDVFFADDVNVANDLLILGRGANSAISLNQIGAQSQISFLGDVTIGAVVPGAAIEDPAINFFNGSTGIVRFDGDISIGQLGRNNESVAANGTAINIGDINGIQVNGVGAQFIANGNVTIEQNNLGPAILVANDATAVTFGLQSAPAQVVINPLTGQSIVLENNSGPIRFNSSVQIGDSIDNQINIENNTGTIAFGAVNVTDATATVFTPIVNVENNTSVSFQSLSITNEDSLSFRGYNNGTLSTGGGTIISSDGAAIDLENNTELNATFTSVTATGYNPFPFGIRVVDDQTIDDDTGDVITNPSTVFRIVGGGTRGSGGLISSGDTDVLGVNSRGAIFQNIDTVELNFQDYTDNEGIAIFSENTVNFTYNGGIVSNNNQEDTDGLTDDPDGFHQILLRVSQDNTDVDSYDYTISNALISDSAQISTNDAMVQIETVSGAANDTRLNLSIVDNQDTTALVPGFRVNRDGNEGAAIRVDWNGAITANVERNGFELISGSDNQIGVDIIQDGTSFTNFIRFNQNTLVATGTGDDGLTGFRMDVDGPTDLQMLDNSVIDQQTGAVTPGFVFAGTNATGFDLTLRSAGNTIVFDDNYLDFNNVGGTGLLFSLINTSDVRIGDDTGTYTNFGNQIDLTDTDATFDRGIIFLTTFGTVNLSGTQDNIITTFPGVGNGTFIPFQPPGSSTGQILINGVLQP
ncbi:hypothetical protein Pan44_15260 [Caulifigura coniformis]|uniref:Inverse autotransporter beta-domain domain-containing protein n=1 Tax=Caulifigura coniformis TaxID=2527983 RepID=A0A517SBM3_9PLAN|nr:inverse autotransporter beta domain-containing protein [Caulifigura coniformis]QDT53504.1 hypothetical protein Pan44_15260 [Caulifigura coniformis]